MRTIELCKFEKKISEINNNLSHLIFVFNQFSLDNNSLLKENQEKLTEDIYRANVYYSQFNVKLKYIDSSAQKTLDYILDTFFILTNTQFEVYLKDVYLFIKNNFNSELSEINEMDIFKDIYINLKINDEIDKYLDNLLVSTFGYFKLLRNSIIHRDKLKRYQGQLKDLIKGNFNSKDFHVKQLNGVQLNKAWASYSKKLDNENNKAFAIRNYNFIKEKNEFTTDDLIDIFNFYRLFGQKIDELIMNKIERKKILMFCYNYYTNYYNLKEKESIEKFLPRFKRVCVISVNLQLDDKEVREFYLDV